MPAAKPKHKIQAAAKTCVQSIDLADSTVVVRYGTAAKPTRKWLTDNDIITATSKSGGWELKPDCGIEVVAAGKYGFHVRQNIRHLTQMVSEAVSFMERNNPDVLAAEWNDTLTKAKDRNKKMNSLLADLSKQVAAARHAHDCALQAIINLVVKKIESSSETQ